MKAVILAGGLGSRLSEETVVKPKPMVEVGGKPILWHIMKMYAEHGINEFVICLGYKGYLVKEYFCNYLLYSTDVTIDVRHNTIEYHESRCEPWRVTLVETGTETMTGGRLKRVLPYVQDDEAFCFTYGDGVSDVNIRQAIDFHQKSGKLATLTAVQPTGKYGALQFEHSVVSSFTEKPKQSGNWINGGFFVLSPKVGEYIRGDATVWEREPMERLAAERQLSAFRHDGFWRSMDTIHERAILEDMWKSGKAPWKIWE